MSTISFEEGIADLEKTNATPVVVLGKAAGLIGVNLEDNIRLCTHEIKNEKDASSHGFKEQWLLRWLLKRLNSSPSKQNSNESRDIDHSFSLLPQSWSLLLELICLIPKDLCLEILQERKFYQTLEHSVRIAIARAGSGDDSTSSVNSSDGHDGPPSKKRKLEPHTTTSNPNQLGRQELLWILLQSACRSVMLVNSSHNVGRSQTPRLISSWSSNWSERASLFGVLLELTASLVLTSSHPEELQVLSAITTTVVTFWTTGSSDSRGHNDDPHRAFNSHCLIPALILLEPLRAHVEHTRPVISAIERLIAVHVVLPGRALFNDRYAKKWKAIDDVLLYDNLKGFLNDFQKTIINVENAKLQVEQSNVLTARLDLLQGIFDIAIRSIPSSDLQQRQLEQAWLDALFISLAQTLWEDMPRVSSSGVSRQNVVSTSEVSGFQTVIPSLEGLVDIALLRKFRLSLPVLGYTMSAVLVPDDRPPPWSLLAKIVELDANILIPNIGLSTSEHFLRNISSRIEDCTVPQEIYLNILERILIPIMHGFARSRNFDGFISFWRDGLENAIRLRTSSQSESGTVPSVLVWDDEDIFDEFRSLVELHAPPSMSQRLLDQIIELLRNIGTKVGSTASEFASLAILCACVQVSTKGANNQHVDAYQLKTLSKAVVTALHRSSDYQAQRWRLWKLVHLLSRYRPSSDLFDDWEILTQPQHGFVSLKVLKSDDNKDSTRKRAARYLEISECFSLVVEKAHSSTSLSQILQTEVKYLAQILHDHSVNSRSSQGQNSLYSSSWDGRNYNCDNVPKVLIACIGRLLQKPEIFSNAETFTDLILEALYSLSFSSVNRDEISSSLSLGALLKALLKSDRVLNNPTLRDLIFDHLAGTKDSANVTNREKLTLLRCLPVGSLRRSRVKHLAATMIKQLNNKTNDASAQYVDDQLATLLHLDASLPGSAIDAQEWRQWVDVSHKLSIQARECRSPSFFLTTNLLLRILKRLWGRILTLQKPLVLSEVSAWVADTITSCKRLEYHSSPYLSLQAFFSEAPNSTALVGSDLSTKKLHKLRRKFMQVLIRSLELASHGDSSEGGLADTKVILDAIVDIHERGVDHDLLQDIPKVQKMAIADQLATGANEAPIPTGPVLVSIQRQCRRLASSSEMDQEDEATKASLKQLSSAVRIKGHWSTEDIGLLASQLDLACRELTPKAKALILEFLRTELSQDLLAPIAITIIVSQVNAQQITQCPAIATELAEIATISNLRCNHSRTGLIIWLEHCKLVLEKQPFVVNQSTLDRVLAALCGVTSSASEPLENGHQSLQQPEAADIYARVCEVLGVILSRHRLRIADRYHLLVPALQTLLRCLFWPGNAILHDMPGKTAANTIITFSKALPPWLTNSREALPSASAQILARLLSSICNPTVSAARSSKKRGYNDLNDETKKARQLAGQYMQYLIMDYTRCSLDGQISPSMKEQLMPGLYSIMDSIDRDLMRTLNADMDPSSRAIFKTLYDDWTRFGKWNER